MSLKDEVLSGSVAQVFQFVVAGFGSVWLAWKLGPKGLGTYAIILSVAFILSRPVNGLSTATKQRAASQDKKDEMTVMLFGMCITLAVVMILVGFVIDRRIEGLAVATIALYAPLTTMATVVDVGRRTWVAFVRVVMMVGSQIVLLVLFDPTVELALIGYVGANVIGIYGMVRVIGPQMKAPDTRDLHSVWEYARYSIPANIFGEVTDRMDVLILGALLGSFASGIYEVAWRITIPISFLAMLAGSGHMRDVASEAADDNLKPLHYVSVLAIPFIVGSVFVGEEVLVLFFGEQYREAWLLLVGLSVFQFLRSQSAIRNSIILGEDRPKLVVKINSVVLGLNVVLGAGLALVIGPIGVVIATVMTELGQLTWYVKETGGPWIVSGVREQILSASTMGLVLLPTLYLNLESIPMTVGTIGLGVITYGTVLFFRPRHRQLIRETI